MPYRPSHRQLEYLVALDDCRHFGEAARQCHVSQPTLSVQVALLEKQLGVTLIERLPGQVRPTPVGTDVISAARIILNGLDEIRTLAASSIGNLGGMMRMGTAPSFGPYFLPYLLPPLHQQYPELKLYIREEKPADLEETVLQGVMDCGLGPLPRRSEGLISEVICRERIFLAAPREHPLAERDTIQLADLAGVKLLSLGAGHRLMDDVRNFSAASGAVVAEDYEGSSLDAIRQMVSINMGLSLFPEFYVRSEFAKDQDIRLMNIVGWQGMREIGIFWRATSARGDHYRQLAELARRVASGLTDELAAGTGRSPE